LASILIVDDSLIMRRNLRTILERNGHVVVAEATNGEDAIRLFELHHPDLVTMDITMPIMNGIEAVKRITTKYTKAIIIVISAFDQRSMLFEAMENGAKQYIIKPITEAKLLQAVKSTLETAIANDHNQVSNPFPDHLNHHMPIHIHPTNSSSERADTISVENHDGRFVIRLPDPLLPEHMNACRVALQGLIFIRPLLLTIDFQSLAMIQPWAIQAIQEIAESIRQAGGSLQFVIKDDELCRKLIDNLPSIKVQDVNA